MTIAQQLEQKGIEKGMQFGEQKVRLDIAVKLLKSGMSLHSVKDMTELSEDELAKFITDSQSFLTENSLYSGWRNRCRQSLCTLPDIGSAAI